jgi:putative DNA primase/helicase
MSDRKLTISYGSGEPTPNNAHLATITHEKTMTWDEFATQLTDAPPVSEDKASAGWYCPASFLGPHRHGKYFMHRDCLALDYDRRSKTEPLTKDDARRIQAAFAPFEHVMYTTASHTKETPRLRVVMPLSRSATDLEFQAVSRKVAALAGIELAARESHKSSQMMFLPTVKPGQRFQSKHVRGSWVDVDTVLASYPVPWEDRSNWPAHREGDTPHDLENLPTPPSDKPGVIGAFCRAFTVDDAIEKFELPYERVR